MPHFSNAAPLTPAELQTLLALAFAGAAISVRDDTHLHATHNEAVNHSGGHYKIKILWQGFAGLPRMARHRLVHKATEAARSAGRIHALTLILLTPEEAPALS